MNTSITSDADCGTTQCNCSTRSSQTVELTDDKLNELVVYLQALGTPSRRLDEVTGEAMADDLTASAEYNREWRTPPFWGHLA